MGDHSENYKFFFFFFSITLHIVRYVIKNTSAHNAWTRIELFSVRYWSDRDRNPALLVAILAVTAPTSEESTHFLTADCRTRSTRERIDSKKLIRRGRHELSAEKRDPEKSIHRRRARTKRIDAHGVTDSFPRWVFFYPFPVWKKKKKRRK